MSGAQHSDRGSGTTAAVLTTLAALIGLITAVLGLVPELRPWHSDDPGTGGGTRPSVEPASIFVNRDSGPGGTEVRLSGEGFAPGERVVLSFHTEQIGATVVNQQGSFSNVVVRIPTSFSIFAPQQFSLRARGTSSVKHAETPFHLSG